MYTIKAGTTSLIRLVEIRDRSGEPCTGLQPADMVCAYLREGASDPVEVTLAAGTPGVWTSGGWVEADAASMPGVYQFGVPNAAIAAGTRAVKIRFWDVADQIYERTIDMRIVAYDPDDGARAGLSSIPNASPGQSGGLPVLSAGLTVAATVSGSATASALADLQADVTEIRETDLPAISAAATAIRETDLPAISAAAAAIQSGVESIRDTDVPAVTAAIDALQPATADEVVAALRSWVVDGEITFERFAQLWLAISVGTVSVSGSDPESYQFRDQNGNVIITWVKLADGSSRTSVIA